MDEALGPLPRKILPLHPHPVQAANFSSLIAA